MREVENSSWASIRRGVSFVEATKTCNKAPRDTAWVDITREDMGMLRYSLVGSWKTEPDSFPSTKEMKAWARVAWRLKGDLMVTFLNLDIMLWSSLIWKMQNGF